jgi:hypothetical protein
MKEPRNAYKDSVGKPKGRDLLKDLGVDDRTVLKWILNE